MNTRISILTIAVILTAFLVPGARATDVVISASKDNTLFEDVTGSLSNGAGPTMFAGKTSNGPLRRALVAFNVSSVVPAGATVTAASLKLNLAKTTAGDLSVALHKVSADWGEGTSNAGGPSGGGGGATATAGDATWTTRFFGTESPWASDGGDFVALVSASATVGSLSGDYTWTSSQLLTDIQGWLANPATNFGWIVIGDETTAGSTKSFYTKENGPSAAILPRLEITYTAPSSVADWNLF